MADKKVVVDVNVDASASVNSMKSIKAEIKSLQGAALQGNQDAIKRIAELKDKIEDLGDATKTLKGSGVEKVTSSFGLLGQGFKDFDFDKIKTGFKGIGSAMSAIPIFLVAEGVAYLVENWKELGKGNGIVAKGIQLLNKAFDEITGAITAFTDMIGLSNSALDKQGEAIQTNADKAKEALSNQSAEYDRQIRVAKAAGKSTIALEKAKQQAIIDTNLAVARQIEAFVRAGGEFDEEKRKLLTASLEAIKGAKVTEFEIEQNHTKELKAEYKKRLDDKKKEEEKQIAWGKSVTDGLQREYDRRRAIIEWEREEKAKEDKLNAEIKEKERQQWEKESADRREFNKKNNEDDRELRLAEMNEAFKQTETMAMAIGNLSNTVFQIKMANVKKGSAEEEKAARKNFKIQKGIQLALAGIDGAKAITASLAAAPLFIGVAPNPAGIAGLAAAITTTGAAIATIAARQFDASAWTAPPVDTSGGSGGGIGGGNISAPNTQAPTTGSQPFTRLDESGRNQSMPTIKAYVVESEMTDKQKRVGRLESQASF